MQGLRSIIGRYKIGRGEVKNSRGNGVAKERFSMTHGQEVRGICQRKWGVLGRKGQRGKI